MFRLITLFERLLSLLIVFLLLTATVLWSGRIFGSEVGTLRAVTSPIRMVVPVPEETLCSALGLKSSQLSPRDSATWHVTAETGEEAGVLLSSAPFANEVTGFAGPTPLYIYVDETGIVRSIVAADNAESPDFAKIATEELFGKWTGMEADGVVAKRVDAVSGATFTSNSLINNAKLTLGAYLKKQNEQRRAAPAIGWSRTVAVFFVLLLGFVTAWRYRRVRWLRFVVLVLNVVVTGFWAGQFLSLTILRGWIENGLSPLLYLPTVVMLAVAIIMPYLGKRNYYCTWICPYGSLQRLAWELPLPKIHLSDKSYRRMRRFRTYVLMALLLALWMGYGLQLLDYEPFTAFLLSAAAPAVVVLGGAFVVAGIFIPTPWYCCLCPVGELLSIAEATGRKKTIDKEKAISQS